MQFDPAKIEDTYKESPKAYHGLHIDTRLPLVDYLRSEGWTPVEIAPIFNVSFRTIYEDFHRIRKVRAETLNILPAKEMAADLIRDAERCYRMAIKNEDPLIAFGIKVKLVEILDRWGLVTRVKADKSDAPTTLAEMRKRIDKYRSSKALPAGGVNGRDPSPNGADSHSPDGE